MEKRSLLNCRYCAHRAQNMPRPAPTFGSHVPDFIQIGSISAELLRNAWIKAVLHRTVFTLEALWAYNDEDDDTLLHTHTHVIILINTTLRWSYIVSAPHQIRGRQSNLTCHTYLGNTVACQSALTDSRVQLFKMSPDWFTAVAKLFQSFLLSLPSWRDRPLENKLYQASYRLGKIKFLDFSLIFPNTFKVFPGISRNFLQQ